jgi:VanZ family protein
MSVSDQTRADRGAVRPPTDLQPVFRLALALCVTAVAYLAFAPLEEPAGFSWDKGNHVLAFFVMAWLADGGWPGPRHAPMRWALLLGYGAAIEVIQQLLPLRELSWLDLLADGIGIGLYAALAALLSRVGIGLVGGGPGCGSRGPDWRPGAGGQRRDLG